MANVKHRLNAPKSASKNESKGKHTNSCTKKELRSLRSMVDSQINNGTGSEEEPRVNKKRKNMANDVDDNMLMINTVSPYDKYSFLHKLRTKLKKKTGVRNTRQSKQPETDTPTPELPGLMKTKTNVLRSSKYLKIMDNVLKSELGISNKKLNKSKVSSKMGVTNNNESELINQNNKTLVENSKLPDKYIKTPSQLKKATEVVMDASINILPIPDKTNKQQTVQVNFTDELKSLSSPPLPKKGRQKKNQGVEKTLPTQKPVELTNSAVLTKPLFECDYCSRTFNRKHSLVRHIYVHIGRNPYSCPVCPKKFRVRKNMRNHIDRDHCVPNIDENTETYSCHICDKPFLTEENLKLHITSHAKGETIFKCIYCGKKFSYQLLLIQHEKKHLVTGKYMCTLCDSKFNTRDKLYVHVKSHLKLIDYICQYCGREFLRANSMRRHIQTMHGGHTIQCPICDKSLKGHLSEHLRTHDKKRPHKCPDCGKRFAQSTQLQVHRRGHTGSRPYSCRICDRPFSHSNALMLHLRRHTGEKPFPCAECPMSFSQLPHMKAHMSKIHGKMNPYKCLKCCDYFKLKKDLLVHKKTCTGTGIDTDLYGDEKPFVDFSEDKDGEIIPVESTMTLSRMRFLLALLLTMIASKEKLKYLGFNKRLVDDLLVESLEAMEQIPCKDETISPLIRLRTNIEKLLKGTVPAEQMEKFKNENKSTEELLELLTSEKEK